MARKNTGTSLKKRQTVSLHVHSKQLKKKTNRRAKRDQRAKITTFFAAIGVFVVTFLLLTAAFIHRDQLVSPLAEKRNEVLAEAKKADEQKEKIKLYLDASQISYATIDKLSGNTYRVVLASKEEVFFSSEKDILKQLTSLQLILAKLTMEGRKANKLDFRYDKPVVTLR